MLYLEYERCKDRFLAAQKLFEDALLEKERLFTKTQSKAITYDRENVQTSPNSNILDDYVIALETEQIDKKMRLYKELMLDRESFLDLKERELRKSPNRFDKVYVCRILDGMSIKNVSKALNYSRSEVYRNLQSIKKNINKIF